MAFVIVGAILCLAFLGMMGNLKTAIFGGVLLIIGIYCIKKGREKLGWRKMDKH